MDTYKIITYRNWLPRFIVISAIILVGSTVFFIYKNTRETFSSENNAFFQKEMVPAELKIDLFKKIEENFKNKKPEGTIDLTNLKNPFGAPEQQVIKVELR